jgi:hypothetical protein
LFAQQSHEDQYLSIKSICRKEIIEYISLGLEGHWSFWEVTKQGWRGEPEKNLVHSPTLISKLALFLEFQHQGCSKRYGTNLIMGANNERQVKGTFIYFLGLPYSLIYCSRLWASLMLKIHLFKPLLVVWHRTHTWLVLLSIVSMWGYKFSEMEAL